MTVVHDHLIEHLLWMLPLLLLVAWLGQYLRQRRLRRVIGDAELARQLSPSVSRGRRRWRLALLIGAIVCTILAAMRPQWGTQLVDQPTRSRDIMVVFDVSRSMLARDLPPSRMQHAKLVVRRIVENSPGDRFGLVAFAGRPFLECPLTQSRSGFLLFLNNLSTNSIPVGGTNIEAALLEAHHALESASGPHRAVLLVTDGDELQGDTQRVLDIYRQDEIPIFVIGLGDAAYGSYIQLPDGSFVTGPGDERVQSKLNASALERISRAVGGVFVHSTITRDGVDYLVRRIRSLIPESVDSGPSLEPIERYQWPLALALLLLLLRQLLGERRRHIEPEHRQPTDALRGPVTALLLTFGLLAAVAPSPAQEAENGDLLRAPIEALQIIAERSGPQSVPAQLTPILSRMPETVGTNGLSAEAREQAVQIVRGLYSELRRELQGSLSADERGYIAYGLGRHYQGWQLPTLAADFYREVLDLSVNQPGLKASALQNLGAMAHAEALGAQQPQAALERADQAAQYYREALRQPGGSEGAARNLERLALLRQAIEEQMQQQQQQQEMEDQRQQAEEQLEQARQEQQQANEAPDEAQRREQQDQAQASAQEAKEQLEEMAEQARRQGNQQQAEQLEAAAQDVRQAMENQQAANNANKPVSERQEAGRQAEEQLADARQKLQEMADEATEPGEPQEGDGDQEGEQPEQPEQTAEQQPEQPEHPEEPGQPQTADSAPEPPPEALDQQQAERILEAIQQDEQNLINEIKRRQMGRGAPDDGRNW